MTYYINAFYEEEWTNGSKTNTLRYYYANGQQVATRDNEGLKFNHTDHLGSASRTSCGDATCASTFGVSIGAAVKTIRYDPWGYSNPAWGSGTATVKYTYTGQEYDGSTTGLMYYGARYYDPALGRFLSADTIVPQPGNPQSLNRYSYTINNPLKYVDPSGHCWGFASGIRGLPSYGTTCANMDMALTIVQHPDASAWDKARAGGYIAVEGAAHVALVVGVGILAWEGAAAAAGALSGSTTATGAAGTATTATTAACADGDCTNEATAVGQAVQQVGQAAQSPAAQRTILWLENQLGRVNHIMDSKHAWDRLTNLSGNAVEDYRAVQPYIQQAINSGTSKVLPVQSPLGTVVQYVATINGQQVVVQAVQLANGAIQITNAWVQTQ